MIFETLCLGRTKTLTYDWNFFHKNEQNLYFVTHNFTKLSQNICLIKTHILIYLFAKCNCNLWKAFWFYCVFLGFSYIIDKHSCLKYCIFTKLSRIVFLINVQILVYWHAKCDCRLRKVLLFDCVLFKNFHIILHIWNVIASSNFYKLCIKAEV